MADDILEFKQNLYQLLMQNQPQEFYLQDKIDTVQRLPVKQRKKTDFFCSIFFAVYFILLALILAFLYNQENLDKITYPTDLTGKLCGYDYKQYPYVYYTTLTDPVKRLCVNKCPKAGDTELSCKSTDSLGCKKNTNPKYEVNIYDTYLDEGRIGLFCLPTDDYLKEEVLKMSNTARKYHIFSVIDSFLMSAWLSTVLGIVFFVLIHYLPLKIVPWTIFIGGIMSILFSIFVLTLNGYFLVKLFLFILFLALGIISLKTVMNNHRRNSVIICSRLTYIASLTHENRNQTKQLSFSKLGRPFLLILCFLLIYCLFFYINIKEVLSAWSVGQLHFDQNMPFYTVKGLSSNFLMILLLIQLIWGAFFIKESFNFIAGSHSTYWYYQTEQPSFLQSVELLLKYHAGSVIGGSLLQGFFYFFDLFIDFFLNSGSNQSDSETVQRHGQKKYRHEIDDQRVPEEQNGKRCCCDFFNLIRGQALSYVALTNNNYCNSARNCEFLSSNSIFYDYSQSTNRIFRINIHIMLIFIVLLVALTKMGSGATPYAILFICVITFFLITYFVSYHAEKVQGLLVSLYVDEALNGGVLSKAPIAMKSLYRQDVSNAHAQTGFCSMLFSSSSPGFQ